MGLGVRETEQKWGEGTEQGWGEEQEDKSRMGRERLTEQQRKYDIVDDKGCGRWREKKDGEVRRRRSENVSESTLYQCLATISLTVPACLLAYWLSSPATFFLPLPAFCSFSHLCWMSVLPTMLAPLQNPAYDSLSFIPSPNISLHPHNNLFIALLYTSPSLCFPPVWLELLWMTACFQYAFQILISETFLSCPFFYFLFFSACLSIGV